MKKLLLLTSSDSYTIHAHSMYLRGLFEGETDVAILSPQEVGLLNEQTRDIPYDLGYYSCIAAYERIKEKLMELNEAASVLIIFGAVGKGTEDWYDAVIGVGSEATDDSGEIIRHISDSKDIPADLLKRGIQVATPSDADAIFYKKDELSYFLRKYVEVERKAIDGKKK